MVDIDKFAKENVLKFLVGNKCDLEHKRVVTFEQGKDLGKDSINSTADKYGIKFLETSAKDTVNINEIFVISTRTFLEKQIGTSTKGNRKTIGTGSISIETENENRKTNNKRKCC